jgi:hypothetical protein
MTMKEAQVEPGTICWVADELILAWKNATFSAHQFIRLRDNDSLHRVARTGQRNEGTE